MVLTLFLTFSLGVFVLYALWSRSAATGGQRHSLDPRIRQLGGGFVGRVGGARAARTSAPALSALRITDILPETLVLPALTGQTKEAVLRELAGHLAAQRADVDADHLVAVLLKRERLGSTAIEDGSAMPHSMLPGVNSLVAAFGRHGEGVDFGRPDGQPTRLFFLLVAPENCAGLHLTALARMSLLLKGSAFREQLLSAGDARGLYEAIRREDLKD